MRATYLVGAASLIVWLAGVAGAAERYPYKAMGAPSEPQVIARWNRYHDYQEATQLLKQLVHSHAPPRRQGNRASLFSATLPSPPPRLTPSRPPGRGREFVDDVSRARRGGGPRRRAAAAGRGRGRFSRSTLAPLNGNAAVLQLEFRDFDVEPSEGCVYDSLAAFGDVEGKDEIGMNQKPSQSINRIYVTKRNDTPTFSQTP